MRIPAVRALRRAARWIASRLVPGGVVLLYHRVAEPSEQPAGDPYRLCVSPRRFRAQMEALARIGRPTALSSLTEGLARGDSPGGALAVTFDDGYVDNVEHALPALESAGVPATVFVVSGSVGRPFWWDRLASAVERCASPGAGLTLELDGRAMRFAADGHGAEARRRLRRALHGALRLRGTDERERALAAIEAWAGGDAAALPRCADESELRRLAASGLVEVGSHGRSHVPLGGLSPDGRGEELRSSRDRLQAILGAPVTSFSYPFGQHGDFDENTARSIREAGYARACTAVTGTVQPRTDPFGLPRLWVNDWTGAEFERRVSRWIRP